MRKNESQVQKPISVPSMVKIGHDVYFHESYGNRIFRYSLRDKALVCLARSSIAPGHRLGYLGVSQYKGRIFFFPYYARKICIYDIQSGIIEYKECKYENITTAVNCGEKIFFWASNQNIIVCWDIDRDIQEEIELPNKILINSGGGGGIEVDGNLYIPTKKNGIILCVDVQTLAVRLHEVVNEEMIFETIAYDGEDFWLSGTQKKVIKWNPAKALKEEYSLAGMKNRQIEMPWKSYFYASIVFRGYVYFSPFKAKQMIRIHIQSGKVEQLLEMRENEIGLLLNEWNHYLYFCCENVKDGMTLMDCLIDENGRISKEKILFAVPDCNLATQEHNRDALRNFTLQIKGEHNEERYFK